MNLVSSPTRLLLTLSMLKGVGPAALKKVVAIEQFEDRSITDLAREVPQLARVLESEGALAWTNATEATDRQLEAADKHRAPILSPLDHDYPRLLAETKDDPFLLFVKGTLAVDSARSVAVIGTREPTVTGQVIAQRIAFTFVEHGWSIVSGLALGCDAIAHQAALNAGGHTVAVLAHGLQMIAPSRHRSLAEDILGAGGALVSEYPFGQGVQSQQFVKRDRTQAGLAQGVVMIQSDIKGGSLHASRAALDYKRWLAVPYPTAKDVENVEPKVQGNLVIADAADEERATLLRCALSALELVRILRDRTDILRLAGANIDPSGSSSEPALGEWATSKEEKPDGAASTDLDGPMPTVAEFPPDPEEGAGSDERLSLHVTELPGMPVEGAPLLPVDAGHAMDSPQDGSGNAAHSRARPDKDRAGSTRASSKRSTRYHVAVEGVPDGHDLQITQVPPWRLVEYKSHARATANDVDLIVVLATRLEHLQERLNEVKKFRSSMAQALDGARSLHLQFIVEDVVMHMKRSVDDLARLEFAKHARVTVDVPAFVDSSQMSLIEAKNVNEVQVDLVIVLNQIVKSLPLSTAVLSGSYKSKTVARRGGAIDIDLVDLVHSFNALVNQALDDEAAPHLERPRSHAS